MRTDAFTAPSPHRIVEKLDADTPTWIVSDLHMGDGTRSDTFFGKDRHLIALLRRAEEEGARVVVAGDGIDFAQAWNFTRVLKAHRELIGVMSQLGAEGRLYYVIGNHDYDISVFQEVLNFRVCHELHLGDKVLVRHGYEYDPFITDQLDSGQWQTKVHHLFERVFDTWVRVPLFEFYTLPNRVSVWLGHKIALLARLAQKAGARFGLDRPATELLANLDFWAWSNMGDSMGIFRPAFQHVRTGAFPILVCGHSHLPGVVRDGDRAYANTGSWTFASSQYVIWDGTDVRCLDWITGREYKSELYAPMIDGTLYERDFFAWWRENYMGWLRFREGEERRGWLKGWESVVRDRQVLSYLRPHSGPLPPPPPAPPESP